MSLDFQQLEEIKKLINSTNYTQFQSELQDNYKRLTLLCEEYERNPSQRERIEAEFCTIKEEIEHIKQKVEQIEFVNRLNEIAFITNIYCPPYLLVNAPMGYGKTRLLEAVKDILQNGWLNIHIGLSRCTLCSFSELTRAILDQTGEPHGQEDVSTPEKAGHTIGRRLLRTLTATHKNVLILLDNTDTECLTEDAMEQFLNQCLPAIQQVLSNKTPPVQLRTIFAGRHITHWKQRSSTIPLELIALTPFDFPAVHQTVENFEAKNHLNMSSEYKRDFAAYLMDFTGGHPGCMVNILRQDYGSPIDLIRSKKDEYYATIVEPVIEEIQRHIPSHLQKVFETLSVFRMYNYPLLQKIINEETIPYDGNTANLEGELRATYLVDRRFGFIQDDIVRRLFAIKVRKEKSKEAFIDLCGKAKQIFEKYLKETTYHPHSVALEGLYQELQLGYYQSDQTPEARQVLREKFFVKNGILQKYLDILKNKSDAHDILANFMKVVQEGRDWELQFALNFFLREDQYNNEPYEDMLKEVKIFLEKRSESNA